MIKVPETSTTKQVFKSQVKKGKGVGSHGKPGMRKVLIGRGYEW